MKELGTISRINIRKAWPNEAKDFTPWLAEHLDQLGMDLNMDLELIEVEKPTGAFSLDILAQKAGTDSLVVIENQLGRTDHDHLGKLITYASGQDASVVVWITAEVRDDHRQALEWLNSKTDTETLFFGVVVEVLQIDGSRPAPRFDVVVSPNDWQKSQKQERRQKQISARRQKYQQFFQGLIDELRKEHKFTNRKKAQPQNWYSFPSGFRDIIYSACLPTSQRGARVELSLGGDATKVYNALEARATTICSELGADLTWEPLDNKQGQRIALYHERSRGQGPSDELHT